MTQDDIFQNLVQITLEVLPDLEGHAFKPEDSLRVLGANSIDRAEIVVLLMESLYLNLPMVDFAGAKNMGELAETCYKGYHDTAQ